MKLRLILGLLTIASVYVSCEKDRVIPAGRMNYIEYGGEEGTAILESGKYYEVGNIDVNPLDDVDTTYYVKNFEVNNSLGFVSFSLASFFDTANVKIGRYEPFSILDTVAPRSLRDALAGAFFVEKSSEDTLAMISGFVDLEVLSEISMDVTYEFILENEQVVKGNYNGLLFKRDVPSGE